MPVVHGSSLDISEYHDESLKVPTKTAGLHDFPVTEVGTSQNTSTLIA